VAAEFAFGFFGSIQRTEMAVMRVVSEESFRLYAKFVCTRKVVVLTVKTIESVQIFPGGAFKDSSGGIVK